jgi:hypothetical protein
MAGSHRQALAGRSPGCLVCDAWNDEMISLVEHRAKLCRPCAANVGRTILATSATAVARLWPASPSATQPRRHTPPTHVNVEEVFTAFKEGLARHLSTDDAQSHFDLAVAYGEMGLMADAIREAVIAFGEGAPLPIASRALNWLFAPGRAHPDALRTIVASLREVRDRRH